MTEEEQRPPQRAPEGQTNQLADRADQQHQTAQQPIAPCPDDGQFSARQQVESQWLLNEFNVLRQEFIERFRTENLLVLGALTFLGTIAGIAFKDAASTNRHILLVIPVMMPLIGMFYLNQRLSNTTIGLYVRDSLGPRVSVMLGKNVLEWEEYVRKKTSPVKELSVFFFILLVFGGLSGIVLVFTAWPTAFQSPTSNKLDFLAWWSAAALSLTWSFLWMSNFFSWFGPDE